jgi:hypothetical protein
VGTVRAERLGIWLLFVVAYPAARALPARGVRPRLLASTSVACAAVAVIGLATRGDDGSTALVARAASSGEPVLADATLAEAVAARGGTVWIANPIDAFHRGDQRLYLAWVAGSRQGAAAVGHARLVLVLPDSAAGRAAARDPRLTRLASTTRAALYRVGGS